MAIRLASPHWRQVIVASCVHLCLLAAQLLAQPRFEGEGRVVALDAEKGTVTLDHGPIPGLMPAMRMTFPLLQAELLRGIHAGDVVQFSLQPRGPEWVIATMEPPRPQPPPHPVIFPAPDFAFRTLSGETIRLSELRGKTVLLNFWAWMKTDQGLSEADFGFLDIDQLHHLAAGTVKTEKSPKELVRLHYRKIE